MKVGILASGNLGLSCIARFPKEAQIECVITDSNSTGIIEWSNQNQIPLFKGNPRNGRAAQYIADHEIDILFSINYLFVIENDLIRWPKKYAFNIHGSLLPKYRGRTPHVWAIINNETTTGLTVHLVDEQCDSGKIVLQKEIEIKKNMTGYDVLKEFEELYPLAIQETVDLVKNGSLVATEQDHSKATYFGKRTPADGSINWNWHRERIYNWVRAQAKPYPGAFTHLNNQRMLVHKIEFDDHGFHEDEPNGKILGFKDGLPIVKTANGAVCILDYQLETNVKFEKGERLHA